MRIGLVDSVGGLDAAVKSAVSLAKITGEYGLDEYPRKKGTSEVLSEMFGQRPPPVAGRVLGDGRAGELVGDVLSELQALLMFSDPRNSYARLGFVLRVR